MNEIYQGENYQDFLNTTQRKVCRSILKQVNHFAWRYEV